MESLTTVNLTDNTMKALFEKLFSTYFLPFEIATVLLLAAIVASIVITTNEREEQ
jgi:NADH:ubiquinone oxidoreductase subunit 6 (subunit J)